MVTLHERNPGVPAHNTRRGQGDRPGNQPAKMQRAMNALLWAVNEERHLIVGESAPGYMDIKSIFGRPERFHRVLVIVSEATPAIEHLNEGMWPPAPEDTGNDGKKMALGGVDDFEVPALEERRALPAQSAVVASGVKRV